MIKKLISVFLVLAMTVTFIAFTPSVSQAATSSLTLTSSSQYLVDGFNWAKTMALSKVHTDNGGCFQAALQDRGGYCQRDYVHQIDGAALLGLKNENFSMLKTFALNQTQARQWFTLWEINYDGTPMACDYNSDTSFWRNTAGMFDLVYGGYRQYQWTANSNLINDSTLYNFYTRTVNDFVSGHDANSNGIVDATTSNGWTVSCSYNEQPGIVLAESGDSLSTQYRAYDAYSKILSARGNSSGASTWNTKSSSLKNTFNTNWYNTSAGRFNRGYDYPNRNPVFNFGYESSWFIPLRELSNPGTNATNYLDFIYSSFNANPSPNTEAWTYLPDVYYTWNQNDRAWYYFKHNLDTRYDYPEVSYTIISQIATGMLGLQPDAPNNKISTLGRLTSEVAWTQLDHIPFGSNDILVKQENSNNTTTVKNNTGTNTITWEAQFKGTYSSLMVDGVATTASQKTVNGTTVSYVNVTLATGQQKTVTTGSVPGPNIMVNPGFESGTGSWTFTTGSGRATNNPHSGTALAYLNAGISYKVSQAIAIGTTGTYTLSAWVAAASTGGKLGIKVNGIDRSSVAIPNNTTYNLQTVGNIALNAGDNVEVYVTGATSDWVNIDDFTLNKN